MEAVISALISLNEHSQNKEEILTQAGEALHARANRGVLESIYHSLTQYPPAGHFFLWVSLLETEALLRDADAAGFIRRTQVFLSNCEKDSVRHAVPKFVTVVRAFAEKMIAANKPLVAIRYLRVALNKLSPSNEHLTPVHALLAQVCLLSKNYKAALQVLDRDILEVDPQRTGVQPLDALLYFYYGGMIYIGLKQFRKAQDFFVQAISAPAQALSAVVVESHRKFILVSLLLEGQVPSLPKYTSQLVTRQLKSINQTYLEFAKAYQTHKQDALKESFAKCLAEFVRDKNAGLASQVVESLYRRNILRLTQTYVTLSLADIATSVQLPGLKNAEEYLLKMIEEGFIHAKIDQKEGMVSFLSNPEQYSNTKTLQKLDAHIKAASALGNRVDDLQRKIALSPQYLRKLIQEEKGPTVGFDDAELDGPAEKHHGGVQLQ